MTTLPSFDVLMNDFDMLTEILVGVIAQRMEFEVCRIEYRRQTFYTLKIQMLAEENSICDLAEFESDTRNDAVLVCEHSFASLIDAMLYLDQTRWEELVRTNLHQ